MTGRDLPPVEYVVGVRTDDGQLNYVQVFPDTEDAVAAFIDRVRRYDPAEHQRLSIQARPKQEQPQ